MIELWLMIVGLAGSSVGTLRTADVSHIVDLDLMLYKLTYDQRGGQRLGDFGNEEGFKAQEVVMRGMEEAVRSGEGYVAVDGPVYRMSYCLDLPRLEFLFGSLTMPGDPPRSNVRVSASNSKMDRYLEYTPLKNGKCVISDGVIWSRIEGASLQAEDGTTSDVSHFFNSTFRDALNSALGSFNLEYDRPRCRQFTTPFTTIFV